MRARGQQRNNQQYAQKQTAQNFAIALVLRQLTSLSYDNSYTHAAEGVLANTG